jgi:hypothetical protein
MPEHYSPVAHDHAGSITGEHVATVKPNGATPYTGTPEWRIADRGTPDTIVTRTRKGRATFEVTAGHVRHMIGADPFRTDDQDCFGRDNLYRIDHITLAQMADRWIERNDPLHDKPCTCDDLTHTVLVLDKPSRRPLWQSDRQRYLTAERVVRRCHCRAFPPLMGLDGGRRNAWHEQGPATMSVGYRAAQGRLQRSRRVTLRRRASDPGTPVYASGADTETDRPLYWAVIDGNVQRIVSPHADQSLICVGHDIRRRGGTAHQSNGPRNARRAARRMETEAKWAPELAVINARLAATDEPEVSITDFPGVTITIRRNAGTRWAVQVVRGNDVKSFRTRTASPIARAVIA